MVFFPLFPPSPHSLPFIQGHTWKSMGHKKNKHLSNCLQAVAHGRSTVRRLIVTMEWGKSNESSSCSNEPVVFHLHILSYPGNCNKFFLRFLKVILKSNSGDHKAIFNLLYSSFLSPGLDIFIFILHTSLSMTVSMTLGTIQLKPKTGQEWRLAVHLTLLNKNLRVSQKLKVSKKYLKIMKIC